MIKHKKDDKSLTMSFEAFRFRESKGEIFIHCSVLICLPESDGEGDCSFNTECGDRRRRSTSIQKRVIRSTGASHANRFDLQTGAIFILESKKG